MRGFLICFIGIDGSGKTTLAKELVRNLNNNGKKFRYVYARFEPLILKPFMIIARKLILNNNPRNYIDYSNKKKEAIRKYGLLSKVYQKILLFDYILQLLFKVKIPLLFGRNIVCDRYIYDTVVDMAIDFGYTKSEMINLLKKCLNIIAKPDLIFLIDVPEEIAYQRKDDTPSIEYLKERRVIYLEIGKEYGAIILDGRRELNVLLNDIKRDVKLLLTLQRRNIV